ncbi:MAG: preprotein translocase subunit YajC [Clostridia bacterium]|nr:preprotein translocase subunit YajC [Clostridia bacterium]
MPQGSGLTPLILSTVFMFALMYLMVILPQRKREKKTREMLSALQVGSNVITVGGVMGKIINIKDDEITVETSVEKTQVKFKKWAIKEVEKTIES